MNGHDMNEDASLAASADKIWIEVRDGDSRGSPLYRTHYFHRPFARKRKPGQRFVASGEKFLLLG